MTAWADLLSDAWIELAQVRAISREYRSKVLDGEVPLEVSAGMRAADNAPCLMLQTSLRPEATFELGGMRLISVPDSRGPLLVLSLEDSNRRDLFTTICADVIAAAAVAIPQNALDQFLQRLDAWRQFLRDRRDGLSRMETIGLIGELVVLEQLMPLNAAALACWEAPADGLHDFRRSGHSLEVKTGLGPSSSITVSRLDQLDTAGVTKLDLLHVRLIESPQGRSLGEIISALAVLLPNHGPAFENALLRRGLLPGDDAARTAPKVQLRTIDAYAVTEGFPRLLRSALPLAITEATYTLEVRALSAFAAKIADVLDAFIQGGE